MNIRIRKLIHLLATFADYDIQVFFRHGIFHFLLCGLAGTARIKLATVNFDESWLSRLDTPKLLVSVESLLVFLTTFTRAAGRIIILLHVIPCHLLQ